MTSFLKKRWSILVHIIMAFFTLIVIKDIISRYNPFTLKIEDMGVGDYLINYQGGFVRRGLLGEIIFHLNNLLQIDITFYVCAISGISLLFLIIFFIIKFRQQNLCWWILPLNICLAGAFFTRKDYFCFVLILGALFAFAKLKPFVLRWLVIDLILCFALNVHEAVFFMIVPMMVILLLTDKRESNINLGYKALCILPIFAMFLLLFFFKGNYDTACIINNSWNSSSLQETPNKTIMSLASSTSFFVDYHITRNFLTPSLGIYGLVTRPIVMILYLIVIPNILFIKQNILAKEVCDSTKYFTGIFVLQLISLLPMFTILSCDMSRIYSYWTVTTILIFLLVPLSHWQSIQYCRIFGIISKLQQFIFRPSIKFISPIALLFICITPVGFDLHWAFSHSVVGKFAIRFIYHITHLISS